MNILNYISIASIGSIIGFIIAFYNKEHDKYIKNRENYFDNFLVKFYDSYRKNANINIKKFFIKNFSYANIYIPPYVNYLLENKEYDKLKKVLLVDYYYLFPDAKNVIAQTLLNISNIIDFLYLLSIFLILMIVVLATILFLGIMGIVYKSIDFNDFKILALLFIVLLVILKYLKQYFNKNDMYSYSEECIDEMIDKKIKNYNKLDMYFLKK